MGWGLELVVGHPIGYHAIVMLLLLLLLLRMLLLLMVVELGLRVELLPVMLGRGHAGMRLALVGPVSTMWAVACDHRRANILLSGAAPIPVLAACQGDVGRGRHRSLPGAHEAPVRLVLGVALEVLLERGRGALLLVHSNPRPSTSSGAELRSTPEIVIAQAAVVLVKTAHV